MAVAHVIRTDLGLAARVADLFHSLADSYAKRVEYRRTLNELQALSGRELADLGLHRSMLKRIALEAAYGVDAN